MVTNVPKLTHTDSVSMRLINIDKFLEMDWVMRMGGQVYHRTKVLELHDDKTTQYAILSHRWIDPTEVDYEEMVGLAKMDREERDEIRGRLGYQKILDTCYQAKDDGYEWMWADTCCIDKRSSLKPSTQCIGGIKTLRYAMGISTMCLAPFLLRATMKSIPIRMVGRSGFRVGGHYRR